MWVTAVPADAPVMVIVASQPGCPACDDYLPRFERLAAPYAAQGLPILHIDTNDERPEAQVWMDRARVTSTPSTYVVQHLRRGGRAWKVEGAVDDATIAQLLDYAMALR